MYVWRKSFLAAVGFLILVLLYVPFSLLRPLPALNAKPVVLRSLPAEASNITWPSFGQAAIGAEGVGVLETHGPQTAVPSASVAKVVTALAVLQKKPLAAGQQGPLITLTASDVALYNSYVAKDGSVVPVTVGEQISEYQVLQAILLPSANNMADSLVVWAFGSLDNYTAFANQYVKQLGLTNTHLADASGFSAGTVTTANDLVKVGLIAMQTPVLAEIVAQPQANITGASTIKNVNLLLGQNGIVGIKTGNTDEAGGVYLAAARTTVGGKPLVVVTAVMGGPNLWQAMQASLPLLSSTAAGFSLETPVHKNQVVATYTAPWGGSVPAYASHNISLLRWHGRALSLSAKTTAISVDSPSGKVVGSVSAHNIGSSETPVVLGKATAGPTWKWRLTHPF